MNLRIFSLMRTASASKARLGMGWLALVVILLGANISVIAGTYSHGLAAIGAALHGEPSFNDPMHGHSHGDSGNNFAEPAQAAGTAVNHPHHGADHAHDTGHALPAVWSLALPQLPYWQVLVPPCVESAHPCRLERPPMG